MKLVFGEGSCGIAAGARKVRAAVEKLNADGAVEVGITGCIGMCYLEPIVDVYGEPGTYPPSEASAEGGSMRGGNGELGTGNGEPLLARLVRVQEKDAERIYKAVASGDLSGVEDLEISADDKEFLEKQTRIALRHCGLIDPEDIAAYEAVDGYKAIRKVLAMTPEDVIAEIKTSGLAGRGGAGFPTWFKWNAARNAKGDQKYLICNADEGDPGAFMDRAVIESDPHSLIEGMLIAAYAIGATKAFVYVRAEYPLAIVRLEKALAAAKKAGLLGENILGSGFSCDIRIKAGAGAFVCGEETALIESLEGNRGMPRLKPPFPAEKGYTQAPSNINNVETFANVAWIILNGGAAFAAMGTDTSKGTKVFALTGKIKRGGLVEIPMGLTLRDVIFGIGGGIRDGGKFKAVQMGGPSGGCIPEHLLDTLIDYKALGATGAIMGSGGMVVMDSHTCMVNMARFFLDFTAKESCGKCVHCRIGTKRMHEILTRITEGKGREGDVELLQELCNGIKAGALCGLGQTAPNPVLTTIRYFRDEYDAHIREARCPAHECAALKKFEIDPAKCKGCTMCAKKCPVGAISGEPKKPHAIDQSKCIKCGQCVATCKFGAVEVK
ncbi:MAG: 4Fe-4S binding protein [Kiritimatiellae bacterium]|nr:4Fe-4S binding protein [Kiritimatiellia bacterium]